MTASIRRGGVTLLIAAVLLIVATIAELGLLGHPADRSGIFVLYLITFLLSLIGFVIAGVQLALGGLAAASVAGRTGLLGFGILWLVAQALYVLGYYVTPSDALLTVSLVFNLLWLLSGLLAAIVVARVAAVHGASRWVLLVAIIISGITGIIAGGVADPTAITVLHLISAIALGVTGLVYALAGRGATAAAIAAS